MHDQRFYPINRGFDEHAGYFQGCGGYGSHIAACCAANPANASDFDRFLCPASDAGDKDYRGFDWFKGLDSDASANGTSSSELIAAAAEAAIARLAAAPAPFFLYLPFQNIHAPYDAAWASVQRFAGLAGASPQQQQMFGYIWELDEAVGRVVAALRNAGIAPEDSVLFFQSDNGAPAAPGVEGRNWPLSGFKASTAEGGARVPAFVHAPGRLPAGATCDALVHVTDWFPTIVALAGGAVPAGLDGVDQWATLRGDAGAAPARTEVLYNINPLCSRGQFGAPRASLRMGDWKLSCFCFSVAGIDGATATGCAGDPAAPGAWPRLFNLTADIGEARNVAAQHPDVVARLAARLAELAGASVQPMEWTPPYQGADYYCADCPRRNLTGPFAPWDAWVTSPPPPGA